MVTAEGADPEYLKRAKTAYAAKRNHALATAEYVRDLGALESTKKAKLLKRLTEQVFVFHGFWKQVSGSCVDGRRWWW